MRMAVTLLRKAGYSVTIAAAVAFSSTAPADVLGLPDSPLFLATAVQPNLIMAIDDSGSMDFEVLFPGNDGSAWWRSGASGGCGAVNNNSFVGCVSHPDGTTDIEDSTGRLNFNNAGNSSGTWKKYSYLFPNGTGNNREARRRLGDSTNDHFAIPPIPAYAWARSPTYNAAYFNPTTTYRPWVNGGGYTFTDATPTATRFDPVFQTTLTIDLTRDFAGNSNASTTTECTSLNNNKEDNFYFKVYAGMTLPEGTCFRSSSDAVAPDWQRVRAGEECEIDRNNGCLTNNGEQNRSFQVPSGSRLAIRYFPATFYLPPAATLPADYGWIGTRIEGKAPNGTTLYGYEIKPGNFATTAQYNAAIQNFANWFQYYRKRHQALRAGLGESFSDVGGVRVNGFTINDPRDVNVGSIDVAANRTALYTKFYKDWVNSGGTPNRTAVAKLIENFRRDDADAPVTSACQRNFGMLFTDGFSNSPAADDGIPDLLGADGNVDGDQGTPYADNDEYTLADAVMSAYVNPLRSGPNFPTGKVAVPDECPETGTYTGQLDCNRDLHMNFYAVTLGTRGLLFNPDIANLTAYTTPPPAWPDSFPPRHPSAVDDIWHATVNGRGQLLNARSPREIASKLKTVLNSITEQPSSAASVAVNSGSISSSTRVYQARFQSGKWTGQLISFGVNPQDGSLDPSTGWDASNVLNAIAASDRNIFTMKSDGTVVPFTWAQLQTDPARVMQLSPTNDLARAEMILNYVRGDTTNEGTDTGRLRVRADSDGPNRLGDIVSSAPLFVGAPPFRYRDSLEAAAYSSFATTNANRTKVVYVGANDGMLHAFDASTGREKFAYIPSPVFPKLRLLAERSYGHQFYVDGSPSMGDAYFNGRWRTVVAGGLNKGGQGVYALDVTNPDAFGPSSVLWEFTDTNDPDLGFTYSQPSIVKLGNGKWYAVFGNGYNSRVADDDNPNDAIVKQSTTGNAVLYIVDLEVQANGRPNFIKLDTGVGTTQGAALGVSYDNGLATPSLVDVDGDRVVDFAYAGDLYGNMWKFDLRANDPGSWSVAFNRQPLFTARDPSNRVQPITVRPEVARGPQGNGVIVLFGTGKYLETSDRLLTPVVTQSFYGIVDRNARVTYTGGANRNTVLTRQTIDAEVSVDVNGATAGGNYDVRVTSNNTLGANSGWYIDLDSPVQPYEAEKQVTTPIVRNGAVIFTTLIPDPDPCGSGGSSWLMELDLLDGSRLEVSPYDLTRDGEFTTADNVTVTVNGQQITVPVTAVRSNNGIFQSPGVLEGEFGPTGSGKPVQYKYLPGSNGNMEIVIENPGIGGTGRQSWRQVR